DAAPRGEPVPEVPRVPSAARPGVSRGAGAQALRESLLRRAAGLLEVLLDLLGVLRSEVVEVAVDQLLAELRRQVAPDVVQVDASDLLVLRLAAGIALVVAARILFLRGVVLGAVALLLVGLVAVLGLRLVARLLRLIRVARLGLLLLGLVAVTGA